MRVLTNKRILLAVTGGIAAYKSPELVRRLRDQGADVRVVMTSAAQEFVTPLTLQAVSGHPVHCQLLDAASEAGMGHIELAQWCDAVLVAPASADFLARLAHGFADDLLAALCLATPAPLLVAPAMNDRMWSHAATQHNIATLTGRGTVVIEPDSGSLACGAIGPGRLPSAETLIAHLTGLFDTASLQGLRVLVSAGPTREAIDPVRYIGNRSSGRMGFATATAAMEAGADVTLVSGPVTLPTPDRVARVDVTSASEMRDAVVTRATANDIFISVAAVADFCVSEQAGNKLKRGAGPLTLTLEPTADIVAEVAALQRRPFVVGFAAETEALATNARRKLASKSLDMIAANPVGAGLGFDSDDNELTLYWPGGSEHLPRTHKARLARQLITTIAGRFHAGNTAQDS